jgi:hypothetical protein
MGEFTQGFNTGQQQTDTEQFPRMDPGKVKTDVSDVFADGVAKDGNPIFTVPEKDFFNNMKLDRKRLRFTTGVSAQLYMRGTRYNKPFWIQSDKGNYMRKIK